MWEISSLVGGPHTSNHETTEGIAKRIETRET